MKKVVYILVCLGVATIAALFIFYLNNPFSNLTSLNTGVVAGQDCRSHSDCPFEGPADCPGSDTSGRCLGPIVPYCDNGTCREPKTDTEWEAACTSKNEFDKEICFNTFFSIKERAGANYQEMLLICDRSYKDTDEAEYCKLEICGYAFQGISPGEDECVKQALSSSCDDGRRNGRESDIDCGGPDCKPCKIGSYCESHADCSSGICGVHGISNRDKCYPICPNGKISENEPCGCFQKTTPQGETRQTPIPNDLDIGSTKGWEDKYGGGKNVYCCEGLEFYLLPGNNCSTI